MFGTDEFGNSRLLPVTFVVVLTLLGVGVIATSQTIWDTPDPVLIGAAY